MAAHLQHDRRQRQREADPEAPRHVGELGIGRVVEARDLGLQRHAADRAASGTDLADLRMHRAGVDRALGRGGFRLAVLFEIFFRIGGEFGAAAGRAEMKGLAADSRSDACWSRDRRSCRRRDRSALRRRGVMVVAVTVIMAAAAGRLVLRRRYGRRARPRSSQSPALETYTLWGYIGRMRKDIKASCQKRLSRIEGQVRGLSKMVDEDRYCIDIVTQISAVRAALRRVEEEVLRDHVSHCVEHAITSGNKADQRRKDRGIDGRDRPLRQVKILGRDDGRACAAFSGRLVHLVARTGAALRRADRNVFDGEKMFRHGDALDHDRFSGGRGLLLQPEAALLRQSLQEQATATRSIGNTPNSPATSGSGFCLSAQCREGSRNRARWWV